MCISIITRAYKTSELKNLINYLNLDSNEEKEIIAVCNINDYEIKNAKIIIENSNRFKAKITGIKNSNYDNVLLLDSDQIPEKGLLNELINKKNDMVIIPEKSIYNNFTSRCLDDWRLRNETYAMKQPTPYIPVIPRFYKRKYLMNAINNMLPENFDVIMNHEDSVLYYEVFKQTKNIGFSRKYILNYDPNFLNLIRKAFLYGQNENKIKLTKLPLDIKELIDKLNNNSSNIRELGFGKGYILQIIRAIAYEFGKTIG